MSLYPELLDGLVGWWDVRDGSTSPKRYPDFSVNGRSAEINSPDITYGVDPTYGRYSILASANAGRSAILAPLLTAGTIDLQEFTYLAQVYIDDDAENGALFGTNINDGYGILWQGASPNVEIITRISGQGFQVLATEDIRGRWILIAITRDAANNIQAYVDGVAVGTPVSNTFQTTFNRLHSHFAAGFEPNGRITFGAVYNKALDAPTLVQIAGNTAASPYAPWVSTPISSAAEVPLPSVPPTLSSGVAEDPSMSAHPNLWEGLEVWVQGDVGDTGPKVRNYAPRGEPFAYVNQSQLSFQRIGAHQGWYWPVRNLNEWLEAPNVNFNPMTVWALVRPEFSYSTGDFPNIASTGTGNSADRNWALEYGRENDGWRWVYHFSSSLVNAKYPVGSDAGLKRDQWQTVAGVIDGFTGKIYTGGVFRSQATGSGTNNNTNSPLQIGSNTYTLTDEWIGGISAVGIWSRVLSDSELQALEDLV